MQAEEITVKVPSEAARAYRNAAPEERIRIEKSLRLSIQAQTNKAAFEEATENLERTMDDIGRKARERGLTDEILRDILDEKGLV